MVGDFDKHTKEKFIKNGAKEFVGGVDLIKVENWVNNVETTFKAMQVPHKQKNTLATCMFQEDVYNWWEALEKFAFK